MEEQTFRIANRTTDLLFLLFFVVFSAGCPELEELNIKTVRSCWPLLSSGIVCPCKTFFLYYFIVCLFFWGAPSLDGIGKLFKSRQQSPCLFIHGTWDITQTLFLH